jgi:hypothetical protein
MPRQTYILLFIVLLILSFTSDKVDYKFFQAQKLTIDSSIKDFQSSDKLFFDGYEANADNRFAKNKYFVRQLKTEYGHIFSDTLDNIIRYMLVQGDCEVHIFYTKNATPFKIDYLKMFGGTMSFYLIDNKKIYIIDDNKNKSWCSTDTSSYRAEVCIDGKKTIYYSRVGHDFGSDTTRYLHKDIARNILKYELNKFDKIKNGN